MTSSEKTQATNKQIVLEFSEAVDSIIALVDAIKTSRLENLKRRKSDYETQPKCEHYTGKEVPCR